MLSPELACAAVHQEAEFQASRQRLVTAARLQRRAARRAARAQRAAHRATRAAARATHAWAELP